MVDSTVLLCEINLLKHNIKACIYNLASYRALKLLYAYAFIHIYIYIYNNNNNNNNNIYNNIYNNNNNIYIYIHIRI